MQRIAVENRFSLGTEKIGRLFKTKYLYEKISIVSNDREEALILLVELIY